MCKTYIEEDDFGDQRGDDEDEQDVQEPFLELRDTSSLG